MPLRTYITAAILIAAAGCGRSEPMLAGGKPVEYWIGAIKGPDSALRKKAAFKLGNVGPADARALPALMEALQDSDAAVRREAIAAVAKFGSAAKDAIPALAELRADRDARVRADADRASKLLDKAVVNRN